jgi:hypothetical protein
VQWPACCSLSVASIGFLCAFPPKEVLGAFSPESILGGFPPICKIGGFPPKAPGILVQRLTGPTLAGLAAGPLHRNAISS